MRGRHNAAARQGPCLADRDCGRFQAKSSGVPGRQDRCYSRCRCRCRSGAVGHGRNWARRDRRRCPDRYSRYRAWHCCCYCRRCSGAPAHRDRHSARCRCRCTVAAGNCCCCNGDHVRPDRRSCQDRHRCNCPAGPSRSACPAQSDRHSARYRHRYRSAGDSSHRNCACGSMKRRISHALATRSTHGRRRVAQVRPR